MEYLRILEFYQLPIPLPFKRGMSPTGDRRRGLKKEGR
jgi:hypothetical protein